MDNNMEFGKVSAMIEEYERLRSETDELNETLKELNRQKEAAENQIVMTLLDMAERTGIDDLSVKVGSRKYSAKKAEYFTIPKADRDEAFQLLRQLGHGDLITERVDDRTLSKELAEVSEAYHKENPDSADRFPAEYEPLMMHMNLFVKTSLSRVMAR